MKFPDSARRLKWIALAAFSLVTLMVTGPARAQDARIDTGKSVSPFDLGGSKQTFNSAYSSGKSSGAGISAEDAEFGEQEILYRRSNWEPWNIRFDLDVFHTDNVALSSTNEIDDTYLRYGLSLDYTPQLKGNLFGDVGLRYHTFAYDKTDALDFDLFKADAGLMYILPYQSGDSWAWAKRDTTLFSRYQFQSMTESGFGDQFYEEHSVAVGLQRTFRIRRGHQAYVGYVSQFAFEADPAVSQRDEHALYAGYQVKWTSQFTSGLQYRAAYYDYDTGGRHDWNHIVALTLSYKLTDWAILKASLSLTDNNSNGDRFDYSNFSAGGGLSLQVSF